MALAALLAGAPAFAQSAAITASSPATLNQGNLRGATVSVTLTSATYESSADASHFTLTTAVPGLTVHSVSFNSGRTVATLRLHYDGSDFNAAATIAVTVDAAGTSHSAALTTSTQAIGPARWVNVSTKTVALTEGGGAGSYTVVLESPPTGDVSVAVTSDNAAVTVDSDSTPQTRTLTFSTTTWNSPQTVTVTPVDDNTDAVDELALVTNVATGGGYASSAVANRTVRVTVADDERTGTDYDADDDQLIEIDSLAKLNAVRWDLNGDGTASSGNAAAYAAAFPGAAAGMGCPDGGDANQTPDGCTGYELTADLDFDTNGDGNVDSSDTYPNWTPIGGSWTGDFNGNNRTISNLTTSGSGRRGLFANLGTGGVVSNLGLIDFNVSSTDASGGNFAGALAGWSGGTVEAVSVRGGTVSATFTGTTGYGTAGGLVGQSATGADIKACYSTAAVSSNSSSGYVVAGGLVGLNLAPIVASYASGTVSATGSTGTNSQVGGLTGGTNTNGPIRNSYATGAVSSSQTSPRIGGLVGFGSNVATASYWDSETTGQSSSRGGSAQTTNGLQTPTGYGTGATDIYAYWDDYDTDGDGRIDAADDAWDFGASDQYPSLKWGGLDPTRQFAVRPATVDPGPPVTPVNRAPYVRRGIDDLDMDPGELARVSLVGVFGDEAPGRLRHAAESSNPSAASARAVGGVVLVEGLAPGLATVTVTAEDEGGLSARTSFSASVGRVLSFAEAEASAPEGGMLRLRLRLSRTSEAAAAFAWRAVADGDPLTADADAGRPWRRCRGRARFPPGRRRRSLRLRCPTTGRSSRRGSSCGWSCCRRRRVRTGLRESSQCGRWCRRACATAAPRFGTPCGVRGSAGRLRLGTWPGGAIWTCAGGGSLRCVSGTFWACPGCGFCTCTGTGWRNCRRACSRAWGRWSACAWTATAWRRFRRGCSGTQAACRRWTCPGTGCAPLPRGFGRTWRCCRGWTCPTTAWIRCRRASSRGFPGFRS